MKRQSGITLVALVITIIVLLILAGVSISLALGQNGVLTRASGAVSANEKAKVQEELNMAVNEAQTIAQTRKVMGASYDKSTPFFEKADGSILSGTGSVDATNKKNLIAVFANNCQTGLVYMVTNTQSGAKSTKASTDTMDATAILACPPKSATVSVEGLTLASDGSDYGYVVGYYHATGGSGLYYPFIINVNTGKVFVNDGTETDGSAKTNPTDTAYYPAYTNVNN